MLGYEASTYGDRWAAIYDAWEGLPTDTAQTVDVLMGLMGSGSRALELGVGTGRVAIPLAKRGVDVVGIDSSFEMIAALQRKAEARVTAIHGDFSQPSVAGAFDLVFCIYNTLPFLTSQRGQVQCLRSAANLLGPDASLVVELFLPDVTRFISDQFIGVREISADHVVLTLLHHDAADQQVSAQVVRIDSRGTTMYPYVIRYIWPSEIRLMAELAGLRIVDVWSDWAKSPMGPESKRAIYVLRSA